MSRNQGLHVIRSFFCVIAVACLFIFSGCASPQNQQEGNVAGYAAFLRQNKGAKVSVVRRSRTSFMIYMETKVPLTKPAHYEVCSVSGKVLLAGELEDLGGFCFGADLPEVKEEEFVVRVTTELLPVSNFHLVNNLSPHNGERLNVSRWPLPEDGYASYVKNLKAHQPPK